MEVASLSDDELRTLSADIRSEMARRRSNRRCRACGSLVLAGPKAVYCSTKCRVAAHRKALKDMWTETNGVIGIGYEGRTLEQLVDGLRKWQVSTLVDVRLNAVSRKRGFSKKMLAAALEEAGIAYVHMPALGNPRDNREHFATIDTEEADRAREVFRDLLAGESAAAALDELSELARGSHVAVFCYEDSELHCHRREVLAVVRDRLFAAV